jgi:hypothetical protein
MDPFLVKTPVLYDACVDLAATIGNEPIPEVDAPAADAQDDETPAGLEETADPLDAPTQAAGRGKEQIKPPETQPVKRGPGRPRKEAPAQRGPNLLDLFGRKRERTQDTELKTVSEREETVIEGDSESEGDDATTA